MMRRTNSTKGIDDLDVERCYGDVFDARAAGGDDRLRCRVLLRRGCADVAA